MAFQCRENGISCDFIGFPQIHPSWNQSRYETLEEAISYMDMWLGKAYKLSSVTERYIQYTKGFKYNGCDIVQIIEV